MFNPTHILAKGGKTFSPTGRRMVKYRHGEEVEIVNSHISIGGWSGPSAKAVEVRTVRGDTLLLQPQVLREIGDGAPLRAATHWSGWPLLKEARDMPNKTAADWKSLAKQLGPLLGPLSKKFDDYPVYDGLRKAAMKLGMALRQPEDRALVGVKKVLSDPGDQGWSLQRVVEATGDRKVIGLVDLLAKAVGYRKASIHSKLVRFAHENPELRSKILPLLE